MAEYKKPNSEAEFQENFKLKKPLMNDTEAYYESSRCLEAVIHVNVFPSIRQ